MTYKIPAILVDTRAKRVECHELITAGPGLNHGDAEAAKAFLENRAKALGLRLAGQHSFENGVARVWVHPAE